MAEVLELAFLCSSIQSAVALIDELSTVYGNATASFRTPDDDTWRDWTAETGENAIAVNGLLFVQVPGLQFPGMVRPFSNPQIMVLTGVQVSEHVCVTLGVEIPAGQSASKEIASMYAVAPAIAAKFGVVRYACGLESALDDPDGCFFIGERIGPLSWDWPND